MWAWINLRKTLKYLNLSDFNILSFLDLLNFSFNYLTHVLFFSNLVNTFGCYQDLTLRGWRTLTTAFMHMAIQAGEMSNWKQRSSWNSAAFYPQLSFPIFKCTDGRLLEANTITVHLTLLMVMKMMRHRWANLFLMLRESLRWWISDTRVTHRLVYFNEYFAQKIELYSLQQTNNNTMKSSHLVLTCQSINNLQDLYGFFSTLCIRLPNSHHFNANPEKDVKSIMAEIEQVLSHDFLEKMPTAARWKSSNSKLLTTSSKTQPYDTTHAEHFYFL